MTTFNDVQVVGMHFRGPEVKALVANLIPEYDLTLMREPDNEYDEYAVQVFYRTTHIGYINRHDAAFIAPLMDEGQVPHCRCKYTEAVRKNIHPMCDVIFSPPEEEEVTVEQSESA